jgi:hypothetical protein
VKNDSATLYCVLSRWDAASSKRVTVGEARRVVYEAVQTWTPFSFPIDYLSGDQPDTITVVFAASAGGDMMKGEPGSTLWIDAVHIGEATTVAETPETQHAVTLVGRTLGTTDGSQAMSHITVWSLDGRRQWHSDAISSTASLEECPSGPAMIEVGLVRADGSSVCHRMMAILP